MKLQGKIKRNLKHSGLWNEGLTVRMSSENTDNATMERVPPVYVPWVDSWTLGENEAIWEVQIACFNLQTAKLFIWTELKSLFFLYKHK